MAIVLNTGMAGMQVPARSGDRSRSRPVGGCDSDGKRFAGSKSCAVRVTSPGFPCRDKREEDPDRSETGEAQLFDTDRVTVSGAKAQNQGFSLFLMEISRTHDSGPGFAATPSSPVYELNPQPKQDNHDENNHHSFHQ